MTCGSASLSSNKGGLEENKGEFQTGGLKGQREVDHVWAVIPDKVILWFAIFFLRIILDPLGSRVWNDAV